MKAKTFFSFILAAVIGLTSCGNAASETSGAPAVTGEREYARAAIPSIPASIPSQVKEYTGFTVSFNKDNGTPNWSAWELTADESQGETSRKGQRFWQDEDIAGCPVTADYKHSGYDHGHLCPAADMKWSQQAMQDCFSMANIAPQDHALNSKAWSSLEKRCRTWARRDGALLICAGPIYEPSDTQRIGENRVRVPSAFFKVIVAPYLDKPRGIAFVYPNQNSPGNMALYAMSIDDVEKLTGFDFFPTLPKEMQDKVEAQSSLREWSQGN